MMKDIKKEETKESAALEKYRSLKNLFEAELQNLDAKSTKISAMRLTATVLIIVSLFYVRSHTLVSVSLILVALIGFILLMQAYAKNEAAMRYASTRLRVNKDELTYLTNEGLPFENGKAFLSE
jgi:membrane protein YdbS with pleckstrin-like domain